jgi:hypothetical protein
MYHAYALGTVMLFLNMKTLPMSLKFMSEVEGLKEVVFL